MLSYRSVRAWNLHGRCWNTSALLMCVHTKLVCVISADTCMSVILWWARCINERFSVLQYRLLTTLQGITKSTCTGSSWFWNTYCCSILEITGLWRLCKIQMHPLDRGSISRTIQLLQLCYSTTDLLLVISSDVHLCNLVACCSQEAKPIGRSIFQIILSQNSTNWRWSILVFSHVPLLTSFFWR